MPKNRLKISQNHDMGKRVGGFVDFGLLTFILVRDEVQSVLSIPRKQFFYMLSTQFLSAWWNLTKSRFWPIFLTILCMKYSILQNRTSFVGSFLDQFTSSMIKVTVSKTYRNHLTRKILLNSIFRPFLEPKTVSSKHNVRWL